ncbi:MAG: M48 family metallopeptidase [Acidobacteria bacterium]|nr:M48 family metallopeptidase [Acidobacteriota bacterium]
MPHESLSTIKEFYEEAFARYEPERTIPVVRVSFYPYIGINHTVRIRDGVILVRIGTICSDMPLPLQRALAYILVGKLFGKRIPAAARNAYNEYVRSDQMHERARQSRRSRARKVVTSSKGEIYDLDELFDELNRVYFGNTLAKPTLTWSAKRTYRLLGHHDETLDHITVSRSFDSASVPRYVVSYILFHEMLHIFHPTQYVNGRRRNHTPAFRRDEKKFRHYASAERWIENNTARMKRAAKRKKR